jgi:hypothetical protein
VPATETTRTTAVLPKARSISPSVKARTKLSGLSQDCGGSNGPSARNSAPVLSAAMAITTSGTSVIRAASTSAR